ncbi:hypothetical protein HPP92_000503 [Vanilla planifolia]|uniref:Exostosin GT47 domain-containing protein n=1 Tax=Vanilla planifolia TaxID=51239 RepID=A0A835S299_VANPL|nr:hypothetical protein HPP92_000503 [Vanilla planifolia]
MEGFFISYQRLVRSRKLLPVLTLTVTVVLLLKTFTLLSKTTFSTEFPSSRRPVASQWNSNGKYLSSQTQKLSLSSDSQKSNDPLLLTERLDLGFGVDLVDGNFENDDNVDEHMDMDEVEDPDIEFIGEHENGVLEQRVMDSENKLKSLSDGIRKEGSSFAVGQSRNSFSIVESMLGTLNENSGEDGMHSIPISSLSKDTKAGIFSSLGNETFLSSTNVQIELAANGSTDITLSKKNKVWVMPPLSMSEMNSLLLKNRASRRSMRPRWSSLLDKHILSVRKEIENAPIIEWDRQLFAPLFRNISKFKKSYELMERTLKVYVYQEGKQPIFHKPLLSSIYASEGWFMKLMESNTRFLTKDPKQAHLFYMPFSSRFLQLSLYATNSHNRTNLRQHLKNYVDLIASKYPFWNRTGGSDHFLAACHDWAPYETKKVMERCIRALCVADLRIGFQLGKDVSLPETNVYSPKNPLRDVGGRPWNQRSMLAFFAGNLHGELRSVLLKIWEDKDPDMKIYGPSTFRAARTKMSYAQYMKRSKYCICPRGYEANSPRLVEAIFFECVPVIIADDYVPPFFELLKWEKFSVVVMEKDVAKLKEILESISESEYRELQMGVKMVQQHFLWHHRPVQYDLFHMILHSVWFNRVYNLKPR